MIFPCESLICILTTVSVTNSGLPCIRNEFLPPENVSDNSVILKYLLLGSVSLTKTFIVSKRSSKLVFFKIAIIFVLYG